MPNIASTASAAAVTTATASPAASPSGLGQIAAYAVEVKSLSDQTGAMLGQVVGDGMTAANLVALQTLSAKLDTTTLSLVSASAVYRDALKEIANKASSS